MIPGPEKQFFFRLPADILLKNAFGDRWNEETGHGGALRAHPSAHGISGGKIWERPGGLRPGAEKGTAGGRGGRGPWHISFVQIMRCACFLFRLFEALIFLMIQSHQQIYR